MRWDDLQQSSFSKVEERFLPILEDVKKAYAELFGNDLIAVYLIGSVGRGQYTDGISDLDVKAILKHSLTQAERKKLFEAHDRIAEKYLWLTRLDMGAESFEELSDRPKAQFIIATQGLLLLGEDVPLAADFPNTSSGLARFLFSDYPDRLEQLKNWLSEDNLRSQNYRNRSRVLAKGALRALMGLVMLKEDFFTYNLREIAPKISSHYPHLTQEAERLEQAWLTPPGTYEKALVVISDAEKVLESATDEGLIQR